MNYRSRDYLLVRLCILLAAGLVLMAALILLSAFFPQKASVFLLVAIACFLILLALFLRFVWRPYMEWRKTMILFSAGYIYSAVFELPHPLCRPEALMLQKFSGIIKKNKFLDVSKKQAEYLALQNQINPHFLYNTLESIRGEAMTAGLNELANMTEAMAKFFRYSIYNVNHLVRLEEELNNINNYFAIQHYRFGDRLTSVIEIDPADAEMAYLCVLPKMTLQPIVENAVFHGIEPKLGKGVIRIKIELMADRLIITVSDNGQGIESERLDGLNHRLSMNSFDEIQTDIPERNGIALMNVNTRIKLLFGENYGLHLYSAYGAGTDVMISLPFNTEEGRIQ